jgi:hypothetical protein
MDDVSRYVPRDEGQVYEELRELYRSSVASRMEEILEELWEDPQFFAEVKERFEEGRLTGNYPALERVMSEIPDESRDMFIVSGGLGAMRSFAPSEKESWDESPFEGNMDSYREALYIGMAHCFHDELPKFAERWLAELARVGYSGMVPYRFYNPEITWPVATKEQAERFETAIPKNLGMSEYAYAAVPDGSRQTLWLQLDGPRSLRSGYREIGVSDKPIRTDMAIVSAMTALEGQSVDVDGLRESLLKSDVSLDESLYVEVLESRGPSPLGGHASSHLLDYVLLLLRYHRPDFSYLPREEKIGLLVHACSHTNEFLDTLKKLMNFLEYGSPDGRTRVATRDADTDVKAAVLRDVDELTYRKIGEELELPRPKDFEVKGDYARVRQMVSRGRKIIFLAIGKDGWRRHIEAMRAEAKRWNSLTAVEQDAEVTAEALGMPYEEAYRIAEEADKRFKERMRRKNAEPEN